MVNRVYTTPEGAVIEPVFVTADGVTVKPGDQVWEVDRYASVIKTRVVGTRLEGFDGEAFFPVKGRWSARQRDVFSTEAAAWGAIEQRLIIDIARLENVVEKANRRLKAFRRKHKGGAK